MLLAYACCRLLPSDAFLFAVVDIYRKQCDEVAYEGDASCGQQDIPKRNDDRVGLHHEAAGHADEPEVLLEQGYANTDYKAGKHSDKRNQPAFQHEDTFYETLARSHAAERLDVVLLFDDEHRQAAEYVECDDDDDEYQYHEDGCLFVFHHLVEGFVLLETVLDLVVRTEPFRNLILQCCGLFG